MKRILPIVLVLVACGSTDNPPPTADPTRQDIGWWRYVQEITLTDGTLCAVANSNRGIAITCNWRNG